MNRLWTLQMEEHNTKLVTSNIPKDVIQPKVSKSVFN